jgi:hypothetical protein
MSFFCPTESAKNPIFCQIKRRPDKGEFLASAHVVDGRNAGIGAEVNNQWTNFDVWERGGEFFEAITGRPATTRLSIGAEPQAKGPTDAGRVHCNERQLCAAVTVVLHVD